MTSWDRHGASRLALLRDDLVEAGLVDFVREAAAEVWRINRDRHEPEVAYDDNFTLSQLCTRNLSNRLLAQVPSHPGLRAAGIAAEQEFGFVMLRTRLTDVRLVKAPLPEGRYPVFNAFDWSPSEGRKQAAKRNFAAYAPPSREETPPLFEVEPPNAAEAAATCRDVFLVWGADLPSGLTAGWLGLPTTAPQPWIAVTPLWWDEAEERTTTADAADVSSSQPSNFDDRPAPVPAVALKKREQEASNE